MVERKTGLRKPFFLCFSGRPDFFPRLKPPPVYVNRWWFEVSAPTSQFTFRGKTVYVNRFSLLPVFTSFQNRPNRKKHTKNVLRKPDFLSTFPPKPVYVNRFSPLPQKPVVNRFWGEGTTDLRKPVFPSPQNRVGKIGLRKQVPFVGVDVFSLHGTSWKPCECHSWCSAVLHQSCIMLLARLFACQASGVARHTVPPCMSMSHDVAIRLTVVARSCFCLPHSACDHG